MVPARRYRDETQAPPGAAKRLSCRLGKGVAPDPHQPAAAGAPCPLGDAEPGFCRPKRLTALPRDRGRVITATRTRSTILRPARVEFVRAKPVPLLWVQRGRKEEERDLQLGFDTENMHN